MLPGTDRQGAVRSRRPVRWSRDGGLPIAAPSLDHVAARRMSSPLVPRFLVDGVTDECACTAWTDGSETVARSPLPSAGPMAERWTSASARQGGTTVRSSGSSRLRRPWFLVASSSPSRTSRAALRQRVGLARPPGRGSSRDPLRFSRGVGRSSTGAGPARQYLTSLVIFPG